MSRPSFTLARPPAALPACLASAPGISGLIGQGVFSWSVFRWYEIRLFAGDLPFDPAQVFALHLTYLRNVSAGQLVDASVAEMMRLAGPSAQVVAAWRAALVRVIPDVGRGDRLTGLFGRAEEVAFFLNDGPLEVVMEPGFRAAFASIWMSTDCRDPALRAQLLGVAPAQP